MIKLLNESHLKGINSRIPYSHLIVIFSLYIPLAGLGIGQSFHIYHTPMVLIVMYGYFCSYNSSIFADLLFISAPQHLVIVLTVSNCSGAQPYYYNYLLAYWLLPCFHTIDYYWMMCGEVSIWASFKSVSGTKNE